MLDASISLFRLEDTGMDTQMQGSMPSTRVLHWFRRFDDYQALKNPGAIWKPLPEYTREKNLASGIMGAGVLGARGDRKSTGMGFPLRYALGRSRKSRRLGMKSCAQDRRGC